MRTRKGIQGELSYAAVLGLGGGGWAMGQGQPRHPGDHTGPDSSSLSLHLSSEDVHLHTFS